jgi:hypothetical protein
VPNEPQAQKSVLTELVVLLDDEAHRDARLVCLEIVLIMTQDTCMVCAERTIGSESLLDPYSMELLGDVGLVESCISLFGDGVRVGVRQVHVCAKRTIGSEIVLDTSDSTCS